MAKFSKNVQWLQPFYEATKDLLPQHKLNKVTGYTVPMGKDATTYAFCHSMENRYKVSITLWIERDKHKNNKVIGRKPATIEELLYDFAHELAHVPQSFSLLEHHPVSHLKLTVRIMARFIKVLKLKKVKSTAARRCKQLGKSIKGDR